MKTNTKRLFLTTLLLGTILSVLTATTVMASTNDTPCGQHICDQDCIQDQEQCCQNECSCPDTCDGLQTQYQHQHGLTCSNGGDGEISMQQARYRYQYRHCNNQED
jgi:hypothetical protein